MTEREKMLAGKLYKASDAELRRLSHQGHRLSRLYNETTEEDNDIRQAIIKKMFRFAGKGAYLEPPFHADYGVHTTVGDNFYANYDAIFVDVAAITIGDNVMLGPRVGLYTAGHPIDADIRNEQLEYGYPITIGDNVWIGGNVVVNPGVTIGSNVVIGSGSIVTKDIPDNVVAVGNPAHVLRPITAEDQAKWAAQRAAYYGD